MPDRQLLQRFIASFTRAIAGEMAAMRDQFGPYEVPLGHGRAAGRSDDQADAGWLFDFALRGSAERLAVGLECALRTDRAEIMVTLTRLGPDGLQLRSAQPIDLGGPDLVLVLYPWFLYERLLACLEELPDAPGLFPASSLRLFGHGPVHDSGQPLLLDHQGLNPSQLRAVAACTQRDLAFVWGPPGTGKTRTLAHVVTELLARGERLLITSTTNAAVDQALTQLAALPGAVPYLDRGEVVRLGPGTAGSHAATVEAARQRRVAPLQEQCDRWRARLERVGQRLRLGRLWRDQLAEPPPTQQLELFSAPAPVPTVAPAMAGAFGARYCACFAALEPPVQQAWVRHRLARLDALAAQCRERLAQTEARIRQVESDVVPTARVVLATMAHVYLNRLLARERFDAVIFEEAAMAVLPVLFCCAALAAGRVILVGDPQQLPPIVQSRQASVRRAMARSIFAVRVPDPSRDDLVVMLEEQYRMHPVIGQLVSDTFYGGRLRHGVAAAARQACVARRPFAGQALVVVDTASQGECATASGSYSRWNAVTAALCVQLAQQAVDDGMESVAVITPYTEQARLVRRRLGQTAAAGGRVECSTVHRFQGQERDCIILDTVDSEPLAPGVLLAGQGPDAEAAQLLNVSVSRARGKLVLLADVAYFRRRAPNSAISALLERALMAGYLVRAAALAS
jgi:hypothetical protein